MIVLVVKTALKIPLSSQEDEEMNAPVVEAYLNKFGLAATERSVRGVLDQRRGQTKIKTIRQGKGNIAVTVKEINQHIELNSHGNTFPKWMRGPASRRFVPPAECVTVVEAAPLYQASSIDIMRLIEEGKLPTQQVEGNQCLFLDLRDIEEAIKHLKPKKTTKKEEKPASPSKRKPQGMADSHSPEDVAHLLSSEFPEVTAAKIWYRIKRGEIATQEDSQQVLIPEKEIDRIIKEKPSWLSTKVRKASIPEGYLLLKDAAEMFDISLKRLKEAVEGNTVGTKKMEWGRGYRYFVEEACLSALLDDPVSSGFFKGGSVTLDDVKMRIELTKNCEKSQDVTEAEASENPPPPETTEVETEHQITIEVIHREVGKAKHLLDRYKLALEKDEDLVEALGELI